MRSSLRILALLAASLLLAPACGGGGDDDDDDTSGVDANLSAPDANPNAPDANTSNPADANTSGASQIGDSCTPGDGWMAQGSCSAGFVCVGLDGGSGTWCTKMCTGTSDTSCATGYTGPGAAICSLTIQDSGGTNPDQLVCIAWCADNTGGNYCPSCDGTCPGSLACTDTGNNWSGCF